MTAAMDSDQFQKHAAEIEQLVERVNGVADPDARALALELLQSVMDLHANAMARIVELLAESGDAGRKTLATLGADPLICGLLVLYGVHPESLPDRVARAIERVSPQLRKQGGAVELVAVTDEVVRLKIQSSGQGCGSSPEALRDTVERVVREAAPEVIEVIADGIPSSASGFVPVNMIQPATKKEEKNYEESAA